MRIFFVALSVILLKVACCAQHTTFNHSYNNYRSNSAMCILENSNGYIGLVSGRSDLVNGWFTFKIFQLDFFGNLQWIKVYGEEAMGYYPGYAGNLNRTPDGNYVSAAMVQDTFGYYKGLLMKFDSNGDTLWTRSVGATGKTEFFNSLVLADGSIMVVGSTNLITSTGAQDAYLLKFDPDGNLLWEKDYGGSRRDLFFQFAQTSDGGFICGGLTESYGKGQTDGYLVKTDSLGNMEWQKTFGTTKNEGATGVTLGSAGEYYIWGYYDSMITISHDYQLFYLYKLDTNGEVLWEKYFPTYYPNYNFLREIQAVGGYLYLGGGSTVGVPNQKLNGWLAKLDTVGNMIWDRKYSYGANPTDWFEAFAMTSDSGFICVGSANRDDTLPAFRQSIWAIKIDSNGCLYPTTACVTGITETTTLQAKLYPNPTMGTLTVELPNGQGGSMALYNLFGQSIYQTTLTGGQTTLALNLPPGLYLYRIGSGGKAVNGKLLVE